MVEDEGFGLEQKSKSQLKREMTSLQDLGEELVELPIRLLERFDLPENLLNAIEAARGITSRGARKRQLQYIGRLMREVDAEPIRKTMDDIKHRQVHAARQLHLLERWRERLLNEGDGAIQALCEEYSETDRQRIRQWLRAAEQEKAANKPPKAARALFHYLRELIAQ
jgi:ribosome-associated protein